MRKTVLLILSILLLLSLCACHAEPPVGSTAAAPSDIDTTTAPSNTYTTTPDGTTAPSVDVDIALKTDGWVNIENVEARDSIFAFGGYYHCAEMGGQILAFTDISNGNTVVLCSKAGCKHHAETSESKQQKCDAYLGSNVFFCMSMVIRFTITATMMDTEALICTAETLTAPESRRLPSWEHSM